jgi:hypothetical protein
MMAGEIDEGIVTGSPTINSSAGPQLKRKPVHFRCVLTWQAYNHNHQNIFFSYTLSGFFFYLLTFFYFMIISLFSVDDLRIFFIRFQLTPILKATREEKGTTII